ncbi:transcription-repair coupling factor [Campylobacter concisus]|uniref:Transcription-repair-coupling factor n=1 Tax=Campylobacter concisus ATCC 51562 TaxID=1242969 RepID=U2GKL4_9BACT|nr:transcription-repair coupling factor [Campylobacter concisus]ERJ26523.1 Transcription-repair coupling factor [Campylobacter concisus ATCC 51562]
MQAKVYEYLLTHAPQILICEDDKEAALCADAASFAGFSAFKLPDFRAKKGDDLRSFNEELFEISSVLSKYYKFDGKKIIISPFSTLLNPLPTQKNLESSTIKLKDNLNLSEFADLLIRFGYECVDIVESVGEFSIRGEVIDIYGVNMDDPVRILLFGDEVESIRNYNTATQISNKNELSEAEIVPFIANLSKDEFEKVSQKIEDMQSDALVSDLNSLGFWAIDSFSDYLKEFDSKLVKKIDFEIYDAPKDKFKGIEILPEPKVYKDLEVTLNFDFFELNKSKNITVLSRNEGLFKGYELDGFANVKLEISPLVVNITSSDNIVVSLNKFEKKRRVKRSSLVVDELKVNDYVVHEDYGIGRFLGLEKIKVLGATKEFVVIAYQNDDKLLLPVEHLNLIDRYIAQNGSMAVLDRLGKANFAKIKEKVREKLFAIASKIVAMAAKRELIAGKILQKEDISYLNFVQDAGFSYTSDQQKAVNDIKDELKSGKVMDRLLSGDVGFGKTEVAMNAIFTCIKSGFSAFFFVPTTLLSSQHYKTLSQRFSKFGIKVFRLDRFSSAKEKSSLQKALKENEPIVCVGTHALLGVKAENLGLIVVDEEHKFGVKQKEQLKEISQNSHILSMSATPIPRSLNMALSKIKTYSILTTPPSSRLDVRTSVREWDEKVVKEAIMRELRRGGQTFYIHNHIADIEQTANELRKILPKLRILILHSKINAKVAEDEMMKFERGEYDLLLCTSIVESGIHLPNANTIIVENANKFGMADLHQLRGRVGRSDKQAYCYFLVEDKDAISKDALKRLVALEGNSFLGAGSVLAYHDLEIRGGGNIIGEAQSGHIEAIGYSLYLKMLEDEINKLLNQDSAKLDKIDLKLSVSAFLNQEFIREDRLRLEIYRRLSKCKEVSEVYEIQSELEDRFGKIDTFTKQFLDLIIIKILALKAGIKTISNSEQNILITKNDDEKIRLKSRSKDDDDVLAEILVYLRKDKK